MKFEEIQFSIPRGWVRAFGQMLVDEINAIAPRSRVVEAKEKWGEMRLMVNNCEDFEEIDRVIDKYSILSRNICICCGKPDVYMTDIGWVSPMCEDCFNIRLPYFSEKTYGEFICGDNRMADEYTLNKWEDGKYKQIKIDISGTADKIRQKWSEDDKDKQRLDSGC